MPLEPPSTSWGFPPASEADENGVAGVGADLEPGTLLHAYRHGLFPMPIGHDSPIGWWSPDPRGILPLDGLIVSRSLARSRARYELRVDTAFGEVVDACSDAKRPGGWITAEIGSAYRRLHDLGWAHSVEAWDEDGLAGGLYGLAVGGLFAGESMFHRRVDASKVALSGLVDLLRVDGDPARLLDVQWSTDHLRRLGAVDVSRVDYLERLSRALKVRLPPAFR